MRYIDAAILRDVNTDTDGLCDDGRVYYLTDANFNVTALIDATGAVVERYVYTPYGEVTIYNADWSATRDASAEDNTHLYTGRDLDGATGLYYYRARWYDAGQGNFLQRDPLGFAAGDANLYRYCGGSPTGSVDPSGLLADGNVYSGGSYEGVWRADANQLGSPIGAFFGSLWNDISETTSIFVEGGYALVTSSEARQAYRESFQRDRVDVLGNRLYNISRSYGYSDGEIGDWYSFSLLPAVAGEVLPINSAAEAIEGIDMGTGLGLDSTARTQRGLIAGAQFSGLTAYGTAMAARTFPSLGQAMYPNTPTTFAQQMTPAEAARYRQYWQRYSPQQVQPGKGRLDFLRQSGRTGRTESSRVIYDEFGRQQYRVDFSDHMRPGAHTNPHLHEYEYGPGFSNMGRESVHNF